MERGEDPYANHYHIPKWILWVFVPSAVGAYGFLQFWDPHQDTDHSRKLQQSLKDENKRDGRAHGCQEIHGADIDKWIETHPDASQSWLKIKQGLSEGAIAKAERQMKHSV